MEYFLNFNYPGVGKCWAIESKEYIGKKYKIDKKMPNILTGQFECVDGKIAWMLDIFVDDELINECKKYDMFLQKANFEVVLNCRAKADIDGFKFGGTFIEALEFVKKHIDIIWG